MTLENLRKFTWSTVLLLISACSAKPDVVDNTAIKLPSGGKIWIVSHDWHTGFVVPASLMQAQLPQLKTRFGNTPYIEFGWGDKGFYQAQEITTGITLRAIFWPTESVMHAVAVPRLPQDYFSASEVLSLCLKKDELALLIDFLVRSFATNDQGKLFVLKKGIYGNSQFYKGQGDYYLMNTCNKWTAKGLRSAKLDISPTFKLTADSVMDYLKKQKSEQTAACPP